MNQADHSVRNGDRDARPDESAMPRFQLDVFCAVEIDAGVAVVCPAGQRQFRIEANNGQTGRHGAKDYP